MFQRLAEAAPPKLIDFDVSSLALFFFLALEKDLMFCNGSLPVYLEGKHVILVQH